MSNLNFDSTIELSGGDIINKTTALLLKFLFYIWLTISFSFRLFVLFSTQGNEFTGPINLLKLLRGVSIALFFDISTFAYWLLIPVSLLLIFQLIFPKKEMGLRSFFFSIFFFTSIWGILWIGEFFFWEEFKARLNFIAVDYLVYTQEILRNIWESYPVIKILYIPFFIATLTTYFAVKKIKFPLTVPQPSSRQSILLTLVGIWGLTALFWKIGDERRFLKPLSPEWREVAKNGAYSFGSAFWQNEIQYDRFYTTLSAETMAHYLDLPHFSTNKVESVKLSSPPNVVVILMESMSARFIGKYGSTENLTPFQDWLSENAYWFSKIYAVGTRTVRGIEALTLSIPPTPGQSIIRRPENKNLYSMGKLFTNFGYSNKFIYGGHAVFDNMGEFFSQNGFQIVDRESIDNKNVRFENAWGVCDQDIFDESLRQADSDFGKKRPFLQFILTTSNHRPYTFPDTPEIAHHKSATGREAAVRYSDFALEDFFKKAQNHKWFENTLFVWVADHNAYVAGNTVLHPDEYLIPVYLYGKSLLKKWGFPQKDNRMGSQMDILPTILEIVGDHQIHPFFGMNLLAKKHPERAWISNYESLGYMDTDFLAVLTPPKSYQIFKLIPDSNFPTQPSLKTIEATRAIPEYSNRHLTTSSTPSAYDTVLNTAVSTYQFASERFSLGKMKAD